MATRDACGVDGFVTVPTSLSSIAALALNVPPVKVMVRMPPETPAVAAGDPVEGEINETVLADKLDGALPESVMMSRWVAAIGDTGVRDIVIVTPLWPDFTLLNVTAGWFAPREP
jgi:hypothetical protein